MAPRRNKSDDKFSNDRDLLEAFHYLAQDVISHPLVVNPQPMIFTLTFHVGAGTTFGWDNPETAPWVELATYVRKLAILEGEATGITQVLQILGRDRSDLRDEIKQLKGKVSAWRGSNKAQFVTQDGGNDASVSIRSNAEAAELVINGYLFHSNANLLKAWRGLDEMDQGFCIASARDWITEAGLLVAETARILGKAIPALRNGTEPENSAGAVAGS
jgi:hypothetical protein